MSHSVKLAATKRLAQHDELTGVPNSREFFKTASELDAADRASDVFIAAIVDVDQVLQLVARTVKAGAGETCEVGRLGGDLGTALATADQKLNRLKKLASNLS